MVNLQFTDHSWISKLFITLELEFWFKNSRNNILFNCWKMAYNLQFYFGKIQSQLSSNTHCILESSRSNCYNLQIAQQQNKKEKKRWPKSQKRVHFLRCSAFLLKIPTHIYLAIKSNITLQFNTQPIRCDGNRANYLEPSSPFNRFLTINFGGF